MRHALALFIGFAALIAGSVVADDDPIAAYKWEARPVIIFADSEKDPRFQRQVANLSSRSDDMTERDVVIKIDTDPTAGNFSIALVNSLRITLSLPFMEAE